MILWACQRRYAGVFCVFLCLFGCDNNEVLETRKDVFFTVEALDISNRRTWSATVADFDNDGYSDFLLAGHAPPGGDRIYYHRGNTYEPSAFTFRRGTDRHDCAAADVNLDGWMDLYCTTGGDKGEGSNGNEYWRGVDGISFALAEDTFGAEDSYGRGRRVSFLNFNGDEYPDLFVTVWGDRADAKRNESSIYENTEGLFQRTHTQATGDWGGRCLFVSDINADGLDDLIVCAREGGGQVMVNDGAGDFIRTTPDNSSFWWIDAKTADLNGDGTEDLVILAWDGALQIRLATPQDQDFSSVSKKIKTRSLPYGGGDTSYASGFSIQDIDGDGNPDFYLVRREGPDPKTLAGDAPDVVIYGPDFQSYSEVPLAKSGQGYLALPIDAGILRLNTGVRWEGAVDLVSVKQAPRNSMPVHGVQSGD